MLTPKPLTMNFICETSPEDQWQGEDVTRATRYTSAAFGLAFALSAGLYAVGGEGEIEKRGKGVSYH